MTSRLIIETLGKLEDATIIKCTNELFSMNIRFPVLSKEKEKCFSAKLMFYIEKRAFRSLIQFRYI